MHRAVFAEESYRGVGVEKFEFPGLRGRGENEKSVRAGLNRALESERSIWQLDREIHVRISGVHDVHRDLLTGLHGKSIGSKDKVMRVQSNDDGIGRRGGRGRNQVGFRNCASLDLFRARRYDVRCVVTSRQRERDQRIADRRCRTIATLAGVPAESHHNELAPIDDIHRGVTVSSADAWVRVFEGP